ncbi:esterase/lipase family protein [Prauserella cavernicola]|uniref:GPI inositol-deacylase PGAP1-like alpha/beta domain-containing protein n=1 Tax=Prauserella cavernicola TaxID=2800127 RepID=A0A934QLM9_9PSEU|nr:hypothetical protein [Prauserella cavernicola]MBK1783187.1 hypothetical protein [Prauserella cavernicola]
MKHDGRRRATAAVTTAVFVLGGLAGTAQAAEKPAEARAGAPIYFVHGYNDNEASDCSSIWGTALDYFEKQGKSRSSMKTVAYYGGDTNCDVDLGAGTTSTRIKKVAASLANRIYEDHTSKGESVEIVAHSMGGLVSRVAILGSAKGWEGFPPGPLKVSDVVTLATPHKGILDTDKYDSTQWDSMNPDSYFMEVLHKKENQLDQKWASGTDWSFVGSDEDETVSGSSAIDKGHYADHKFRYLRDADYEISHTAIRKLVPGKDKFNLRYWHASEGESHNTTNGWAPLQTAYNALDRGGDW